MKEKTAKMPLLPKVKDFLDKFNQQQEILKASHHKTTALNNREGSDATGKIFLTEIQAVDEVIDDEIMSGKYPICVRIYNPNKQQKLPVLLYFHGGGFVSGNVVQFDPIFRQIANYTNHIVVGVEYRLAPEFPYPICVEDSKTAIAGIFDILDARDIGYLDKNLSIAGDSAGGGICTIICSDRDFVMKHNIKHQVLFYPVTDFTLNIPSIETLKNGYFLTREKITWYFNKLFQNNEDLYQVSPLFKEFYSEMPKTLTFISEYCPLKDCGTYYYNKIKNIVAESELIEVKGVTHAFLTLESLNKEECISAYKKMNEFLAK